MKKITLFVSILISIISIHTNCEAQIIISTFAGNGTMGYTGDGGRATAAELYDPSGIAVDRSGNVYFADQYKQCIRKVNTAGIITTFAGNGTGIAGFSGDGGPANAATLSAPVRVAVDDTGNVYIADAGNNRIRKVNLAGIISTVAGDSVAGYTGDSVAATSTALNVPYGVAVDRAGNIYIADFFNNRVRKVNTSGIISTIAGNGTAGFSGDSGLATASVLNAPNKVAVDGNGNVYIADENNNRIRKIDTSGIIYTFAGNGISGYSGDGGHADSAELGLPVGVAVDDSGNVFITDQVSETVRKVNIAGIINSVAGDYSVGFSGDGGLATSAQLNAPYDIACSSNGKLYIADYQNARVRVVNKNSKPIFLHGAVQAITTCKYTADSINAELAIIDSDGEQTEIWSITRHPLHGTLIATYSATSTEDTITPLGLSYTPISGYIGTDSFVVQINDGFDSSETLINVAVINTPHCDSILGINETLLVNNNASVIIYPDPSNGLFTIAVPLSDDYIHILITDVYGNTVTERNISSKEDRNVVFNLTNVGKGTYFVATYNGNCITHNKFVIF